MSIRFLVVDDTHFMRKMSTDYLTQYGYLVVGEAANGREAIEQFTEVRPDIVLMDLTMPEMNGIDAIKEILILDPGAIVIVCSASNQQDLIFDALDAGAKGYILKPFSPEQMNEAITKDALPYLSKHEALTEADEMLETYATVEVAATTMDVISEECLEAEETEKAENEQFQEGPPMKHRPHFITSYMCSWHEEINGQNTAFSVVCTENENKFVVEMNSDGFEKQSIQFSLDGFRELNVWLAEQLGAKRKAM